MASIAISPRMENLDQLEKYNRMLDGIKDKKARSTLDNKW